MIVLGLLLGTIFFMVPLAILVLIILAIVKKNKDDKGNFEESIRNIYIYIILIVTFIAIVAGIISTLRIGLDVILPEESTSLNSYSTNEMQTNQNIIELFTTLSLVICATPIFIYHNRLVKKEKIKSEKQVKDN